MGFPGGSDSKESACVLGDLGSIPGLGRSPGEGNSYPLQYSGLENSMDRSLQAIVHAVSKSRTWLSDFHFHLNTLSMTEFLLSFPSLLTPELIFCIPSLLLIFLPYTSPSLTELHLPSFCSYIYNVYIMPPYFPHRAFGSSACNGLSPEIDLCFRNRHHYRITLVTLLRSWKVYFLFIPFLPHSITLFLSWILSFL